MIVDSQAFRAVMGRFATGVTVVTSCQGNYRYGITVNAFTSLSLDPPLVLICIERNSRVHQILLESRIFAVNLLSAEQEELSRCFASTSELRYNDFCEAPSHAESTGAPVLEGTLGFLDCRVVDVFPGGDHSIFVGHVEALSSVDASGGEPPEPLLYFRSRYLRSQSAAPTEGSR